MNMINVVIIGQNEGKYIEKMYNSLKDYPYSRIWVIDRCTDGSEKTLNGISEFYIKTPESWQGRKTSSARNLGLSLCDKNADVLFLDGDRYPVKGDLTCLEDLDSDIALFLTEKDFRNSIINYQEYYRTINNGFDRIINEYGELFPTDVEKWWGVEDTSLGDLCYKLGFSAGICQGVQLQGKIESKNIEPEAARERFLKLNQIWNKKC